MIKHRVKLRGDGNERFGENMKVACLGIIQ